MLLLCRQIIWEWEVSQGREKSVPSTLIEKSAEIVLAEALKNCGVPPIKDNIEFLDRCLSLLCSEAYAEDYGGITK